MNNVNLIGRLTADPELKRTQSGTAMVRFSIAVDRAYTKQGEEKQTDFINCIAWDKKAEFICKYFSKGQKIALTGSIKTGSYTDKDGNKRNTVDVLAQFIGFFGTGATDNKRNTVDVWDDNVEFCESRKGGTSTEAHTQEPQKPVESRKPQEPIQYDDNDLPF